MSHQFKLDKLIKSRRSTSDRGSADKINHLDGYPRIEEIQNIISSMNSATYNGFMFVGENIKYILARLNDGDIAPMKTPGNIELIRVLDFTPKKSSFWNSMKSEISFLRQRYLHL